MDFQNKQSNDLPLQEISNSSGGEPPLGRNNNFLTFRLIQLDPFGLETKVQSLAELDHQRVKFKKKEIGALLG